MPPTAIADCRSRRRTSWFIAASVLREDGRVLLRPLAVLEALAAVGLLVGPLAAVVRAVVVRVRRLRARARVARRVRRVRVGDPVDLAGVVDPGVVARTWRAV